MQKVVRKYPNYDTGPVKNPFDRRYGGMLTQREMRATDFEPTNYGNKKGMALFYFAGRLFRHVSWVFQLPEESPPP